MEHTDLTEQQYQVLTALGDSSKPLSASELGKKLPLIETPFQRVALNKLFRLELVDRIDTANGYIYELSNAGQALITQQAKEALAGKPDAEPAAEPVAEPKSYGEEGRVELEKAQPTEQLLESVQVPVIGELDGGPLRIDLSVYPDNSVELVKFPGLDGHLPAGSLDHLLTEINYEPPRPDDLDGLLTDLDRMVAGFRPRFPDVATGLERVRQLLDEAYPANIPESSEQVPA